jgi:hypothetical protein
MKMKGIFRGTIICNIKSGPASSFGLYEIAGGWREELDNLYIQYYSGYQIKEEDPRSA